MRFGSPTEDNGTTNSSDNSGSVRDYSEDHSGDNYAGNVDHGADHGHDRDIDGGASAPDAGDDKPSIYDFVGQALAEKGIKAEDEAGGQARESSTRGDDRASLKGDQAKGDLGQELRGQRPGDKPGDKPAEKQAGDQDRLDKHPRFREVIQQRNTLQAEVERHRPMAERWGSFQKWRSDAGLEEREVADLMRFGALVKHDPRGALEYAEKFLAPIREFVGASLPKDLHEKVDQGLISEDDAKEMARLRVQGRSTSDQVARMTEQRQAEDQARFITEERRRVADWEAGIRQRDPDYDQTRATLVGVRVNEMQNTLRRKFSGMELVAALDLAYQDVLRTDGARRVRPEVRSVQPAASGPQNRQQRARNVYEHVDRALGLA